MYVVLRVRRGRKTLNLHSSTMLEGTNPKTPKQLTVVASGAPLAGKGYLCTRAARELESITHVSMGDLLRDEKNKPGSLYAQEINNAIQQGRLVSGELSIKVLQDYFSKRLQPGRSNIILDGFPRNIEQATLFEEKVLELHPNVKITSLTALQIGPFKTIILLECSKEKLIERLGDRVQRSARVDDTIDTFEIRYQGFLTDTIPIVEDQKRKGAKVLEVRPFHEWRQFGPC